MRRSLLLSMLAVAVGAILLLGLPLAVAADRLEKDEAEHRLSGDAAMVASGVRYRLATGQPAGASQIAMTLPDRYVVVRLGGGPALTAGREPPPRRTVSARVVIGQVDVTVAADVSIFGHPAARALLLTGVLAAMAIGMAVGLAARQARRLAAPLGELAEAARRLGSDDRGRPGRRYGMRELDQVADGLDRSAGRVAALLATEREFARDASHQLRTPLTALSMRLEEMIAAAGDPEAVREEGAAALAQTQRLTDVVSQLLRRTAQRPPTGATVTGIDEVIEQQLAEWDPAFRRRGRRLEIRGARGLVAAAGHGGVAQVIATLVENALVHGAGTVTIQTRQTPRSVVIEVGDEGPGVPDELAGRIFERYVTGRPGGTGLGLALARDIAAADGGRVVLVRPRPAAFAVFLPRVRDAAAGPGSPRGGSRG